MPANPPHFSLTPFEAVFFATKSDLYSTDFNISLSKAGIPYKNEFTAKDAYAKLKKTTKNCATYAGDEKLELPRKLVHHKQKTNHTVSNVDKLYNGGFQRLIKVSQN